MDKKKILYGGIALILLLVVAVIISVFQVSSLKKEVNDTKLANEQLQLTNEQLTLANDYAAIDAQFRQLENDAIKIENDTITAKYNASKARIQELINELNSEKAKSKAQIEKLQSEINTLRGLLKHYLVQIDSLNKENTALRAENKDLTGRNLELSTQVADVTRQNETLTEIKTLAEKLNVTNVQLMPLNKKGKQEKKIKKAKQLMVTFTIAPNNTTPPGRRTIYLRLTSPEGSLLGNAGVFSHDNTSLNYTEKRVIEYDGSEMPGVQIYWTVNTTLNAGEYTVELFDDSFRLASKHFTFNK